MCNLHIHTQYVFVFCCGTAGDVLASVQTKQAPNTCAAVSTCGRFIACAGEGRRRRGGGGVALVCLA